MPGLGTHDSQYTIAGALAGSVQRVTSRSQSSHYNPCVPDPLCRQAHDCAHIPATSFPHAIKFPMDQVYPTDGRCHSSFHMRNSRPSMNTDRSAGYVRVPCRNRRPKPVVHPPPFAFLMLIRQASRKCYAAVTTSASTWVPPGAAGGRTTLIGHSPLSGRRTKPTGQLPSP
ncbi:hypothetical protein BC628DRAFT_625438 [Trametes gibbosa]|nr:hypothetical protein BC628DRAFT_625438 [Trametes gibbosa]